jgi:hypothetical protein
VSAIALACVRSESTGLQAPIFRRMNCPLVRLLPAGDVQSVLIGLIRREPGKMRLP